MDVNIFEINHSLNISIKLSSPKKCIIYISYIYLIQNEAGKINIKYSL